MPPKAATGIAETRREWYWLGYDQKKPVRPDQWSAYEPSVQYHLSASYDTMKMEERSEGLVLDLATFTDPPSPYQVRFMKPVEVANPKEADRPAAPNTAKAEVGCLAIAGYPKELWEFTPQELPTAVKEGKLVAGFYQVFTEHVPLVEELMRYLTDPTGKEKPPSVNPRRRVVLLIEHERPAFLFSDVDRFRRRKPAAPALPAQVPPLERGDSVPPGDAVFQWWWGDVNGDWGHWKNYHPHVSERLEKALSEDPGFAQCQKPVEIDEVRYLLQRISKERPFDKLDENLAGSFREVFLPESVVTVDHPLYDDSTRACNNCFVQFQKGNPRRRRPVRRIRRGEAAGLKDLKGNPCTICLSETGVLTGCPKSHIVCDSCLWRALRVIVGDVQTTEGLCCGCLTREDTDALRGLAKQADSSFQALLKNPPRDGIGKQEFAAEMAQVRHAFKVCANDAPPDMYSKRIETWFETVRKRQMEHLYYPCYSPECDMDNWILRTDFDAQYRNQGILHWQCRAGHRNSVLPSQKEIDEMNRNILLHPENYTDNCSSDQLALRRFRLCPDCVNEGLLTFAVHEAGCKMWPGSESGHRHRFCFHCTQRWATAEGGVCNHQIICRDPGIQQVRRCTNRNNDEILEIGFIDAPSYITWLRSDRAACPPTVFRSGQVQGLVRQGQLGMEDKDTLMKSLNEGTI